MKKLFVILIAMSMIFAISLPALAAPVTVSTFTEFKVALEDSTTTYIQFANDIQLEKKAVAINPAKPELVIDGGGYTLTGYNSSSRTYTLNLHKKGVLKEITFQNMDIVGTTYYGIIAIDDSSSFNDVTVTFDQVNFTGPALAWVRKSTFVLRDSDVLIVPSESSSAHEVAEALHVRLEGKVNIVKDAPKSSEELFWITGSTGGVAVAEGAIVNVSNNQNGSKTNHSGFVHFSCASLYIHFENDCVFNYVGNNLFQQGDSVDDLYVGQNADVFIQLYGELYCSYGIFHVRGTMLVDEGANMHLYVFGNNQPQPALQLRGRGELIFNSPQEVLIYNSSIKSGNHGLAMGPWGCDVSISFIDVKSIEYWYLNAVSHPANLGVPTYFWSNIDGAPFSAFERVSGTTVKEAYTIGYYNLPPFNNVTAALKNVNVVRINGGYKPNEAQVVVICMDAATGEVLGRQDFYMTRGSYGPYGPFFNDPDYVYREWLDTSDPVEGTIAVGQVKTIVFLYDKAKTVVSGSVVWEDFNNLHSTRPVSVNIGLLRNGAPVQMSTVTSGGDGKFEFADLPLADPAGVPYNYSIIQQANTNLSAYETVISGSVAGGFTVTNKLISTADILVNVAWDDFGNTTGRRPATITVGLFRNGAAFKMQPVAAVTTSNQQTVLFSNVEKYDAAGNEYVYTVVEQPINGYVIVVNNYTITNSIIR